MNTIINVRTLSAIAVLAISAGMPIASYAAADARVIDSYNEGSEPVSLQPAEATVAPAPEVARNSQESRADARSVDSYNEGWVPTATQTASSAPAKLPDTVAQSVGSVNEGE
jgi:hypothetical protein